MKTNYRLKKGYTPRMMKQWMFSIVLFTLLIPTSVWGQNKVKVTGFVFDTYNEPLVGAMVKVSDPAVSIGTYTGLEGQFSLEIEEDTKLEISFIGYDTQYAIAKNGMKIILKESAEALDEVVVVGYGTQKRSEITGAISSVTPGQFNKQQTFRATDALQGRVAGVTVANTSGSPFATTKIRIRGANSINGGNAPLFVVNGVLGAGMPDAEEIESIEVLKDASATALYGSRGANGVILITTKKGTAGKTQITFDAYGTLQTPSKYFDLLDAATYAEAYNYTMDNEIFSQNDIDKFRKEGGTDWQREVLQNSWLQRYRLNVSGGSEKVKFYISGDYKKQEAMIVNKYAESYGVSSRLDAELLKNVKFEWNFDLRHSKDRNYAGLGGGGDAIIFNALTYSPTDPIFVDDAKTQYLYIGTKGQSGGNPVLEARERDSDGKTFGVVSNMAITWEILKGFTAQYRFNYNHSTSGYYDFKSDQYNLGKGVYAGGNKTLSKGYFQNLVLNYNKVFNKHTIGLTGVIEGSKSDWEMVEYTDTGFDNSLLGYWGIGTGHSKSHGVKYTNEALLSYVARANYNYGGKYYVTATIRRDGSSKFSDDNKWGNFPSISVAWRLSEEEFIKKLNIFSNLKLRASYGVTGNQGVGAYSTISQLITDTGNGNNPYSPFYDSAVVTVGYAPKTVNSLLTWEKTAQYDFGIDAGILDGRLSATLEFYKKRTTDLLLTETSPYYLGGDVINRNKGRVDNKGIEASLTYVPISTKDMYWEISANVAKNSNKIVDIGLDPIYLNAAGGNNDSMLDRKTHILKNGISMGSIFGWKCLGVWQNSEADEAAKYGQKPGDWKYADIDQSGVIDDGDRVIIGNGTPDFTFGLNTNFNYKNFDFNLMLHGACGSEMLNVMYAAMSTRAPRASTITLKEGWENAWRPNNESNIFANPQSTTAMMKYNSDRWVENSSFLRLKNLSIGYTFDKNILKYGSIRIYVSSQNLFTLTKYKGYDPEATATAGSDIGTGIDSGIDPTPRSFTFGAQLNF